MSSKTGAGAEVPQSVVVSPMALPPLVLQEWMAGMTAEGELGEVDTIAVHKPFMALDRGGKMADLVRRWYGECLTLHSCTVLDLVLPFQGVVSRAIQDQMLAVFRSAMPQSAQLEIRQHNVLIPAAAAPVKKVIALCVDPRLQDLMELLADIEHTRLLRMPGPDGTFGGSLPRERRDRDVVIANIWQFLSDMDCPTAQVGVAGHENCGKRNFVHGGELTVEEDRRLMVEETSMGNMLLHRRGFMQIPSALNETGSHFVVKGAKDTFEVARTQPR
ncbi:hypothetical protein HOI83_03495 [Candidatus Uhrbacteria bacterium]|jgi:hypothetical protein|nr:hypothetical protein [Candidatus Uhrbacteria bacterium]